MLSYFCLTANNYVDLQNVNLSKINANNKGSCLVVVVVDNDDFVVIVVVDNDVLVMIGCMPRCPGWC